MTKGIRVTVEDLETGKIESRVVWNDYFILTAGNCYLDGVQAYANGTHVLTLKRDRKVPLQDKILLSRAEGVIE